MLFVVFLYLIFGCTSTQTLAEKANKTIQSEKVSIPIFPQAIPELSKNLRNNTEQVKTAGKEDDDLFKDDLNKGIEDLQSIENIT